MTYDSRLIQETLARAQRALHEGDLSRANRLLQRLHAAGHADAASHQMLAIIGADLGLFDQAQRHMDASRRLAPAKGSARRHLVIRAWGAGFWADVLHTVHGLALAEATGRVPIVHWGRECRYRRAGVEEAWRLYFEPVSSASLADAERDGLAYFPPKWTRGNLRDIRVNKDKGEWSQLSGLFLLNRAEDVIILDFFTELDDLAPWLGADHPLAAPDPEPELGRLYRRHLRLVPPLAEELDRLAATLLGRRPTIAMHFRNQALPKVTESANRKGLDPGPFVAEINTYLASHPDAGIYLMTDFAPAVQYLRAMYGGRVACREVTRLERIEEESLEIHQQHDGVVLGREVVLDTFLAARCDAFVGDGASGVSQAVARLKDWPKGAVTLLRAGQTALAGQIRRHADPSPWWNPTE
jgi:hypothetical protein